MVQVYVGIGSNIDRERQIRSGVAELAARFGPLTLSTVYESEAVGFAGENFLNLVARFETDRPVEAVAAELRAIEAAHGRVRGDERFAPRTLDIDLLLYGELVLDAGGLKLPREEILTNAFVLRPLAELAPGLCHPRTARSLARHWEEFDRPGQALWPVPFSFDA